ncbi:MAG: hypothetical protein Q8N94_06435 [Methanoregula sp.]|nr:hypothetical protein [Methanoregula sp.]
MNSEKIVVFGRLNLVGAMGISIWGDTVNFLFQGSLEIFHASSAQKFSIKVWLKIFWQGLVDRYATFKQWLMGQLKFSGQGTVTFFQLRSG